MNVFEAYTETWAVIFNIVFNKYLSGNITDNNIIKIVEIIHLENLYSLWMTSNILIYFKFNSLKECLIFNKIDKRNIKKNTSKFNQGTSVFSYYILKSILLYHLDDFLYFCKNHNSEDIYKFKGTNTDLIHFIINQLDKSNYIINTDQFINYVKLYHTQHYHKKSLRMTLFND
jgi:hypothetical protein